MEPVWIIVGVALLAIMFGAAIYNRLVALRQTRRNAFSDIDVQLKQRASLVPQLVETVKGYAAHEKGLLENVTQARANAASASREDRAKAEGALGGALMNLLAVAENYPDLKADQNFQKLMAELSDIENKIAAARRFFNNATAEYNTAIQQFPAALFAGALGFREETFFELEGGDEERNREAPEVKFT